MPSAVADHPHRNQLWYRQGAANDWNAALPIGNGRLGAMVFGNVDDERIQLNEDTVWSGGARDRLNPDARGALPRIREFLAAGRLAEAEALANRCLSGIPDSQLLYQPMADLWLELSHPGRARLRHAEETLVRVGMTPAVAMPPAEHYRRHLDLGSAEVGVTYRLGGITYQRTHLASHPDGVVAIHLAADRPGSIGCAARLTRGTWSHYAARYLDTVESLAGEGLLGRGRSGGVRGHDLAVALRGRVVGGRMLVQGETLVIEGADEALLVVAGATSFRAPRPEEVAARTAAAALALGWADLRRRHRQDHAALFDRVRLDLAGDVPDLPTDERVARLRDGRDDPDLLRLFFDYGRYLLIASSRPGSLPANLQGRWCQDMEPSWGSKYTININTQMNYWPAEPCDLPECHEPLFDLVDRLMVTGARAADAMYGCRGFVVHHNADLAADPYPTDRNLAASFWPMGGAWLSLHLWDRWLFRGERSDLERAWPALREASAFFLDFLVPDARGRLVVSPSCSPENAYRLPDGTVGTLCAGASMDAQILDRLFAATEDCAAALGVAPDLARAAADARRRLPQPAIGRGGQLQEWAEDYEEVEPGHRHVSHLFALYPGGQVDPIATPAFAAAAAVTLDRRLAHGGGGTGWSRAWIINFYARLLEGGQAHHHLRHLVAHATLPNLFDDHPPFQIDGNFGACAGVVEMLVQSHRRRDDGSVEVHVLPALPSAWPAGHCRGIRVRGGGRIEVGWADGQATLVHLDAVPGSRWQVRLGRHSVPVVIPAQGRWRMDPREFPPTAM
jgi:alpha-L-fucosidase 2